MSCSSVDLGKAAWGSGAASVSPLASYVAMFQNPTENLTVWPLETFRRVYLSWPWSLSQGALVLVKLFATQKAEVNLTGIVLSADHRCAKTHAEDPFCRNSDWALASGRKTYLLYGGHTNIGEVRA